MLEIKEKGVLYEIDKTSLDGIIEDVVKPYLTKQPFYFSGYSLTNIDVERLIITQTERNCDYYFNMELTEMRRNHGVALISKEFYVTQSDKYCVNITREILKSIQSSIDPGFYKHEITFESALNRIERITSRFHIFSNQLKYRHADRSTVKVNDKYDVQDLLHALLKIDFDDIRAEEYTPSYAGGSSRIDFLLKIEKIVIEVKKTRTGLEDKEIGNELLEDIARYKKHPDCKTLICFVYDPDLRVRNPVGLKQDLESQSSEGMKVILLIYPK